MKARILNFAKKNKLISSILCLWFIIICILLVSLVITSTKKMQGVYVDPSINPPISQHKIDLLMSQPDLNTAPVKVSPEEREKLMNQTDSKKKVLPPESPAVQEQNTL